MKQPLRIWSWCACSLLVGFVGGVSAERLSLMPGHTRRPSQQTLGPFYEAWGLVEENFVDRQALRPREMTAGAIQGMLDSLGDVGHTSYLSVEEVKELESSLEGHFSGIGARMTVRKGEPTIVQVMPTSPAEKSGLRPGDVLLDVNGKDVHSLPLSRIVDMVRGPEGTGVDLHVLRPGAAQPLDFRIIRAKVAIEDVAWRMLPGTSIGHLALQEFGADADAHLRKGLEALRRQGMKGLIVDLRGNPGGLKDQAVAVTSEFLRDGIVFWEQDAQGKRTAVPVESGGAAVDVPLCVLIDEGTASSAEIFAGAIQDHGRGTLVGMRTFGTGTVLRPFALSDGSAILLAVDLWLTPKERVIWHRGIQPDREVSLPATAALLLPYEQTGLTAADLQKTQDLQLREALKVLSAPLH